MFVIWRRSIWWRFYTTTTTTELWWRQCITRGYNNNDDEVEDNTTAMRNDEYNAKRMRYDTTTRIHLHGYDNEDTPTRLRQRRYNYKATQTTIDTARWRVENEGSDVLSHHEQRKVTDAVNGKVRLQQKIHCKEVGINTNLHLSAFVEAMSPWLLVGTKYRTMVLWKRSLSWVLNGRSMVLHALYVALTIHANCNIKHI